MTQYEGSRPTLRARGAPSTRPRWPWLFPPDRHEISARREPKVDPARPPLWAAAGSSALAPTFYLLAEGISRATGIAIPSWILYPMIVVAMAIALLLILAYGLTYVLDGVGHLFRAVGRLAESWRAMKALIGRPQEAEDHPTAGSSGRSRRRS
jgi:hypothetical protein